MWISNPLASPYFVTTFAVAVSVLGGTLVALLLAMRGNLQRLGASVLFRRWRVWVVIAVLYGLAVATGPLALLLLVAALTWQGLREYADLAGLPPAYRRGLLAVGLGVAPLALLSRDAFYALAVLLVALALAAHLAGARYLAWTALGCGSIAWLLAHLLLLDRAPGAGPGVLLVVGLSTALSDVGAFVVGKRFGRHALAPVVSPNKTWEGTLGNLAGAALGTLLLAGALPPGLPGPLRVALPLAIAAGAVAGDLLESRLKRICGAKDAGAWLPGFGGLLDRLDSLLLVAPLVYYLLAA